MSDTATTSDTTVCKTSAINTALSLGRNRGKEKTYKMSELLASLKGPVVFSYPCFDTVENKELFPATILLQAYRLLEGDIRKDYSHLEAFVKRAMGYVPRDIGSLLDTNEWWLGLKHLKGANAQANARFNAKPNSSFSLDQVFKAYPGLARGSTAYDHRLQREFTPYDGRIKAHQLPDPRSTTAKVLSPSQLETLAKCPFSYFLKHVLYVRPIEELVYDPGIWLDPAQRGTLLHKIFETYFNAMVRKEEKPSLEAHRGFLFEVAEEAINEERQVIPPPSEAVFQYERQELLDSCGVFLRSEEEHSGEGIPLWFEFRFGFGDAADIQVPGQEEPVFIEYKPGTGFYLRGSIDRVDKTAPNTFRVLDYKTGSTFSYKKWEPFKGGRQLQYALYALALETILRKSRTCPNAVVNEGGYIFPSVKGEGQRIIRKPINRDSLGEILDRLFDLMGDGCFNLTETLEDCKYCDYKAVCNRSFFEPTLEKKLMAPELINFWEVRKFA